MLSRRAFLFTMAVLAAGCVGSAPGGRLRVAAGEETKRVLESNSKPDFTGFEE